MRLERLKTDRPFVLIAHQDLKDLYDRGAWEAYRKQFSPSAVLVEFSLPGYTEDKSAALVYWGIDYAARLGHGELIYLLRKTSGWQIHWKSGVWIA